MTCTTREQLDVVQHLLLLHSVLCCTHSSCVNNIKTMQKHFALLHISFLCMFEFYKVATGILWGSAGNALVYSSNNRCRQLTRMSYLLTCAYSFSFKKLFSWKPKSHVDSLFHSWERDNIYNFFINGTSKYFNTYACLLSRHQRKDHIHLKSICSCMFKELLQIFNVTWQIFLFGNNSVYILHHFNIALEMFCGV